MLRHKNYIDLLRDSTNTTGYQIQWQYNNIWGFFIYEYQPLVGIESLNHCWTRSRQCSEPGLENEPPTKPIAASRHTINPPPLAFPRTMVPQSQLPNSLGRKTNPITATKHLELARLLKTPEHVHRHSARLVPLQAIQVQPQYQNRRARSIQRERRLQPTNHQNLVPVSANQTGSFQDVKNVPPLVLFEPSPRLGGLQFWNCAMKELPLTPPRRTHIAESVNRVKDQNWASGFRWEVGWEL